MKATQINLQGSLIQKLMLYEFEQGHNAVEEIKNICCAKDEGTDNLSTVASWLNKFRSDCMDLDDQAKLGRLTTQNRRLRSKPWTNKWVALEEYQASLWVWQSSVDLSP